MGRWLLAHARPRLVTSRERTEKGPSRFRRKLELAFADRKLQSAVPPRLVRYLCDERLGSEHGVSHSWSFEH